MKSTERMYTKMPIVFSLCIEGEFETSNNVLCVSPFAMLLEFSRYGLDNQKICLKGNATTIITSAMTLLYHVNVSI